MIYIITSAYTFACTKQVIILVVAQRNAFAIAPTTQIIETAYYNYYINLKIIKIFCNINENKATLSCYREGCAQKDSRLGVGRLIGALECLQHLASTCSRQAKKLRTTQHGA